jgi:hypothetical protein
MAIKPGLNGDTGEGEKAVKKRECVIAGPGKTGTIQDTGNGRPSKLAFERQSYIPYNTDEQNLRSFA